MRNLRHTNTTLLMKWVSRMMQAPSDMVTRTLMDSYGTVLDWGQRSEQRRGESAFYKGLRPIFAQSQMLFQAKLRDGAIFRFWADDWSGLGPLRDVFPRLYRLSATPEAMVQQAWCNTWCPPSLMLCQNRGSRTYSGCRRHWLTCGLPRRGGMLGNRGALGSQSERLIDRS